MIHGSIDGVRRFRRQMRGHGIEVPPPVDLAGVPETLSVRQCRFHQASHGGRPVEVEVAASHAADATVVSPPTTATHHAIGTRLEDDTDHARRTHAREDEDLLA